MSTSTPWGRAQHSRKIAPGIILYSTARHGGVHVSQELNSQIPEYMRDASGWYEEDCKWCIPSIALNVPFSDDNMESAVRTFRAWYPDQFEEFFDVKIRPGESMVRDRAMGAQAGGK